MIQCLKVQDSGEVFTWGINVLKEFSEHIPYPHLVSVKKFRFRSISCGVANIGAMAVPLLPTWPELKPLLVGWKKDIACSFHFSKGISIDMLQRIVEFAWDCVLPQRLKIE